MSDWTFIVDLLRNSTTQQDLETKLAAYGCEVISNPKRPDLAEAILSVVSCKSGIQLIENSAGDRLVSCQNSSFGWRILAVLGVNGNDRVVLQKAAGTPGPYYVGPDVERPVKRLAASLRVSQPTQDFLWFAPEEDQAVEEPAAEMRDQPAQGLFDWLRRLAGHKS